MRMRLKPGRPRAFSGGKYVPSKEGFILGAGAGEGFFSPFKPADGLMRGGAQILAGRIFQTVIGMIGHSETFPEWGAGAATRVWCYWIGFSGPVSRGSRGL